MENDIIIEELTQFTPEIAERIRHLATQLDTHFEELSDEDLQTMLISPDIHLFVAKTADGHIVGMTTLATYRIPYKKKAWIEDVVVDESQRGKGIGTIMIQAVIDYARSKGIKAVDLTSNPTRESANQLYQRLGFNKRETSVYRFKLD